MAVAPLQTCALRTAQRHDNTSAESGLNKLFSTAEPLGTFLRLAATWAHLHRVQFQVEHLAGEKNIWAGGCTQPRPHCLHSAQDFGKGTHIPGSACVGIAQRYTSRRVSELAGFTPESPGRNAPLREKACTACAHTTELLCASAAFLYPAFPAPTTGTLLTPRSVRASFCRGSRTYLKWGKLHRLALVLLTRIALRPASSAEKRKGRVCLSLSTSLSLSLSLSLSAALHCNERTLAVTLYVGSAMFSSYLQSPVSHCFGSN